MSNGRIDGNRQLRERVITVFKCANPACGKETRVRGAQPDIGVVRCNHCAPRPESLTQDWSKQTEWVVALWNRIE